jgi:hypothetical protein
MSALGSDTDRQAMFRCFVEKPSCQVDFDAVRRIDPDVLDLTAWLRRNR